MTKREEAARNREIKELLAALEGIRSVLGTIRSLRGDLSGPEAWAAREPLEEAARRVVGGLQAALVAIRGTELSNLWSARVHDAILGR